MRHPPTAGHYLVMVKVSTSKREPEPPLKVRKIGPEPVAVRVVETVLKVSQLPVLGTVTEPSSVPVGEPERTRMVPPGARRGDPGA